jgi:hypothetical protein
VYFLLDHYFCAIDKFMSNRAKPNIIIGLVYAKVKTFLFYTIKPRYLNFSSNITFFKLFLLSTGPSSIYIAIL